MKTFLLICMALVCASTTHAQEVRLDSLWAKFGGFASMTFTPDSKQLLLAAPDGAVGIYESTTGLQQSEFTLPANGFGDIRYTPDGRYLIVSEKSRVKILKPQTWDSLGIIENVPQVGFLAFSDDNRYAAVANRYSDIVVIDLEDRIVKTVLSRPDKYNITPNHSEPYWNGKVCFSSDGKYIIGKYANTLVQWDWKNSPDKPETLFALPNYAILGFSPDKKYMAQQSNYIWDIQQKKQEQIEGLDSYYNQEVTTFSSTLNGTFLVVTKQSEYTAQFINIAQKKVVSATPLRYAYTICISPDSNYLSYNYADGMVQLRKINWQSTGVTETPAIAPSIQVNPLPSSGDMEILVNTERVYSHSRIEIRSMRGELVAVIHESSLPQGGNKFSFSSLGLASGSYNLILHYDNLSVSHQFIIAK